MTDAVAWLDVLRAEPRASRVFLLGHSEGALVATLAAQQAEVAGLVVVAGAPAGRVIERQLAASSVPEALQDASRRIVAALEAGRTVSDVPTELAPLFRPSVQPYLASWLPLDPTAELARVRAPVLVVQGTTDLQVGLDDARRLAAARPGAELVLIEGMNHVLKWASPGRAANLASYADPNLPLVQGLEATVETFLKRRGPSAPARPRAVRMPTRHPYHRPPCCTPRSGPSARARRRRTRRCESSGRRSRAMPDIPALSP